MKNLTMFQKILLALLVICLPVGVFGCIATMPTGRDATPEEMSRYGVYDVLDTLPGEEGQTLPQRILALCTADGTESASDNTYNRYRSETLGQHLTECATLDKVLSDGTQVYIYYTDAQGISVFLTLDEAGLKEQSVYDPQKDIMFYASREVTMVYENFSNYAAG